MRHAIADRLLLFYLACFCGWLWEVLIFWILQDFSIPLAELLLVYRGVLHGPWTPIYGVGCMLLLFLYEVLHRDIRRFIPTSLLACSVVEYGTSWILETVFHAKWWDYSEMFLNLQGRICLFSVITFTLIGFWTVHTAVPWILKHISRMPFRIRFLLCFSLTLLFLPDVLYALVQPNLGLGVLTV